MNRERAGSAARGFRQVSGAGCARSRLWATGRAGGCIRGDFLVACAVRTQYLASIPHSGLAARPIHERPRTGWAINSSLLAMHTPPKRPWGAQPAPETRSARATMFRGGFVGDGAAPGAVNPEACGRGLGLRTIATRDVRLFPNVTCVFDSPEARGRRRCGARPRAFSTRPGTTRRLADYVCRGRGPSAANDRSCNHDLYGGEGAGSGGSADRRRGCVP